MLLFLGYGVVFLSLSVVERGLIMLIILEFIMMIFFYGVIYCFSIIMINYFYLFIFFVLMVVDRVYNLVFLLLMLFEKGDVFVIYTFI